MEEDRHKQLKPQVRRSVDGFIVARPNPLSSQHHSKSLRQMPALRGSMPNMAKKPSDSAVGSASLRRQEEVPGLVRFPALKLIPWSSTVHIER